MENSALNPVDFINFVTFVGLEELTQLSSAAHCLSDTKARPKQSTESEKKMRVQGNSLLQKDTSRPPVNFTVTDDNAFVLLVNFSDAARAAGWIEAEIEETVKYAMSGRYSHLQRTLAAHTAENHCSR